MLKNEMGQAYGMNEGEEKYMKCFYLKPKKKEQRGKCKTK
jgi:hypothetical protein